MMVQVLTKAWTAALLNALGDILAQKVVDKNEHLDMKRLGIFTLLVSPPALPLHYARLLMLFLMRHSALSPGRQTRRLHS